MQVEFRETVSSGQGLFYDIVFTNMKGKANSVLFRIQLLQQSLYDFFARVTLEQRNTAILFVLCA